MEDAQEARGTTVKPRKKFIFEGDVLDMPEDFEESSKPSVSAIPELCGVPKYFDGTPFPANYFEHETVIGYHSDEWPINDGVNDGLDFVPLFEDEDLRCCILDVVALQYYGSERLRAVKFVLTGRSRGYVLDFSV